MNEAAILAGKNIGFGFTIPILISDYKEFYIGVKRLNGVAIDSAYGLCFRYCLGMVSSLAFQRFPGKPLDIHFVLESGHPNLGNAESIFKEIRDKTRPSGEEMQNIQASLRAISRGEKTENSGLQMADVSAYNCFQYECGKTNLRTVELAADDTMMKVARKRDKLPIFYLPIKRPQLEFFREGLLLKIENKRIRRENVLARLAGCRALMAAFDHRLHQTRSDALTQFP